MTRILTTLTLMLLTGCASAAKPQRVGSLFNNAENQHYAPEAASALAFDPPVAPLYPLLGLDRSTREAGAFIGYQESVTESFSIGMEDHQSNDPAFDYYDRSSYSEKVGVRYR